MISNLWIDLRKDNWNRLDALLRQVEGHGLRSLSQPELRDLGLLYRQAAADLSAVRADRSSRTLEQYLNKLVARAHNFVYSGSRNSFAGLWRFMVHGYPRLLRRLSSYVWLATAITLAAAALGVFVTLVRPEFGEMFLGPDKMEGIRQHHLWMNSILSIKPQASSQIMTNNITVCFVAFAAGITAGLGTILTLFFNGLMLGTIATVCAKYHLSLSLWSFIAAHGALELPSIMLAGAAGLRLAAGILFPGMLRRKDSLALAGLEAVQIVAGTIPLLTIAGTLEAFLSPTHAPAALKFAVGALLFGGLCLWLGEGGRTSLSGAAPAATDEAASSPSS
ncbi:MAG TPA: stage II sporulation protein M [Bryocella sp.]|nr:stage II sporulation protein M [Bryocella sp.]